METLTSSPSMAGREPNAPDSAADAVSSRPEPRLDRERSRRPASGRRPRSWSRRSKLLLSIVVVMILIDFFTALLLGTQVYTLGSQNDKLRASLEARENELRQLVPQLHALRADRDALIRGKLPRLQRLQYDRVLPLDDGYLKNVTFSELRSGDSRGYEYKLVVQNNTRVPLWPEVKIYLFNEAGIQIGGSEIGTRNPAALKAGNLGVGEMRSYSDSIKPADEEEKPMYFMIRIPAEARAEIDAARLGTGN